MSNTTSFPGDINVNGSIRYSGSLAPKLGRSDLEQDTLKPYPVKLTDFRKHDDFASPLPSTALTDDLGIIAGSYGSAAPSLQTEDHKDNDAATANYGRVLIPLPAEYVDGETVVLRVHAGMLTTVASEAATLDVEAWLVDEEAGVSGSDLYTGAAQSINSVTLADKDFTLTPTSLTAGAVLDVRLTTSVNDDGTGTAVKAIIGAVTLLCDVKG